MLPFLWTIVLCESFESVSHTTPSMWLNIPNKIPNNIPNNIPNTLFVVVEDHSQHVLEPPVIFNNQTWF